MAGLPRLGFLLTPFLRTQPDFEGENRAFRKEQQFPRFMPLHGVASAATPTTNPPYGKSCTTHKAESVPIPLHPRISIFFLNQVTNSFLVTLPRLRTPNQRGLLYNTLPRKGKTKRHRGDKAQTTAGWGEPTASSGVTP